MAFSYGVPETGQPPAVSYSQVDRPRCWGLSDQYNNSSRQCLRCPVQSSCRDEIIRAKNAAPPSGYAPQPLYRIGTPPQPFNPPVPVPAFQQPPQQFRPPMAPSPSVSSYRPPMPAVPQQQAPRMGNPPSIVIGPDGQYQYIVPPLPWIPSQYGQLQDPMFHHVTTTAPMYRPQMHGETFLARVFKNALLGGLEMLLGHLLLGARQAMWAPPTRVENQPQPWDVTPR